MTDAAPRRVPGFPPADWNDTARAYPEVLLHEAFEAQVARTPDAHGDPVPR